MNERNYNKQKLTDYLLGTLPEPESERFDELSFTDDDFSDQLKAAENDLIDAYLNDELSGAMLENFKTHYLASPLRREKLEFAKTLQAYAAKNAAQPDSENASFFEQPKKPGFFALGKIFANPAFGWASFAAVLILLIFAGIWLVKRNSDRPENDVAMQKTPAISPTETPKAEIPSAVNANETPTVKDANSLPSENKTIQRTPVPTPTPKSKENINPSPIVASFVLSPPLRGTGNLPSVSFSKNTTLIKMSLKLEGDDYKTYRVALVDESNRQLWQSGNLKSANDSITAGFPAKLLKSGVYSLVLSGFNESGEAEIISNYSFRSVVK